MRRRRRGLWLALALLLVAAGAGAFLLLGGTSRTTVPPLQGLHRASVLARTRHSHVHPVFSSHYSHAAVGAAIAQIPAAGTRVRSGSNVRVLVSAGPPPVAVPNTVGEPAAEAEEAVAGAGLRYALRTVSAPGHVAESVLAESPSAAASVPNGSTVTLTIAASPRWRALTSFSGVDDGQSVPFSIRGRRWRLAYSMSYRHTCLLLVVCEGPSASVEDLDEGSSFGEFELDEGGRKPLPAVQQRAGPVPRRGRRRARPGALVGDGRRLLLGAGSYFAAPATLATTTGSGTSTGSASRSARASSSRRIARSAGSQPAQDVVLDRFPGRTRRRRARAGRRR